MEKVASILSGASYSTEQQESSHCDELYLSYFGEKKSTETRACTPSQWVYQLETLKRIAGLHLPSDDFLRERSESYFRCQKWWNWPAGHQPSRHLSGNVTQN